MDSIERERPEAVGADLAAELRAIVGPSSVVTEPDAMAPHLCDWRGLFHGPAIAVVRPGSTGEVSGVVRACARRGVSVVPQGGNTGLVGGAVPGAADRAVVVHLGRMNRILDLDPLDHSATVQAGCILEHLQEAARDAGRLFPLSFGAEGSCHIGGAIATNAGGARAIRYGVMRDLVLGLEVVLPDGAVWNGLRAVRKDNTGYDLKHLFIGSEGTLGIVTAATLKLFPLPVETVTALVAIRGIEAAVDLLGRLRAASGDRVECCELMDRPGIDLALRHVPGVRDPLCESYGHYLLIELASGRSGEDLGALLEEVLAQAFEDGTVRDATIAASASQAAELWRLREAVVEGQRLDGPQVKCDVAVPVSRVPEFLRRAESAVAGLGGGLRPVAFGHLGDGNIHFNVMLPAGHEPRPEDPLTAAAVRAVYDVVVGLGGSISAEHGVGQLKRRDVWARKDPLDLSLMRSLKRALDPEARMNPGKVFDPAP